MQRSRRGHIGRCRLFTGCGHRTTKASSRRGSRAPCEHSGAKEGRHRERAACKTRRMQARIRDRAMEQLPRSSRSREPRLERQKKFRVHSLAAKPSEDQARYILQIGGKQQAGNRVEERGQRQKLAPRRVRLRNLEARWGKAGTAIDCQSSPVRTKSSWPSCEPVRRLRCPRRDRSRPRRPSRLLARGSFSARSWPWKRERTPRQSLPWS